MGHISATLHQYPTGQCRQTPPTIPARNIEGWPIQVMTMLISDFNRDSNQMVLFVKKSCDLNHKYFLISNLYTKNIKHNNCQQGV